MTIKFTISSETLKDLNDYLDRARKTSDKRLPTLRPTPEESLEEFKKRGQRELDPDNPFWKWGE